MWCIYAQPMSGIWESRQSTRHPTYRLVSEPVCHPVSGNCSDRLLITSNKNIEIDMYEAIKMAAGYGP
ncbi:hypothetical protein DdX_22022 [Ditylenchus destructor]|uniref:Uncharacterized protein n=1 Tax=Ditylenchus destructor TaxID=166010 RepID=A0AAD4MEX4_9BILA|nr:hypothetical protein DdX_22022 [Ditylenchus destructor]